MIMKIFNIGLLGQWKKSTAEKQNKKKEGKGKEKGGTSFQTCLEQKQQEQQKIKKKPSFFTPEK